MINFEHNTVDLNLFKNILRQIRFEPDRALDIIDSFSENQFKSKQQLLSALDDLNILSSEMNVAIFGCWYGSILVPALAPQVNKIHCIDLDDLAIRIGKNRLFENLENVKWHTGDCFEKGRITGPPVLFINTSCEHMKPMKEWDHWFKLKELTYFAVQSNNMDQIEGHINCVNSLDEFKAQMPNGAKILYENELPDERGIRYTLIGEL